MGKEGLKFKFEFEFEELRVWQKGKGLAVYIYQIYQQKEISSLRMFSNSNSKLIAARSKTFCLLYTSRTKMKQDIYCAIAKLVTAGSELIDILMRRGQAQCSGSSAQVESGSVEVTRRLVNVHYKM